jgi:hypothetical protein
MIEFTKMQDSDTYARWHSEEGAPAGHQTYIIARYHWSGDGRKHKVDDHYSAYYHSMHFKGSERFDTFKQAEDACLAHFEMKMKEGHII